MSILALNNMDQFDINTAHVRDAILHREDHVTFPFRHLELYLMDFLTGACHPMDS